MIQEFSCGDCGLESEIELPHGLDEDAITAFRIYRAEHDKQSPECPRAAKLVKDLERMVVEGSWPHSLEAGVLN
jgi:hypothetical protein